MHKSRSTRVMDGRTDGR